MTLDSFGARSRLSVGDRTYDIFRLDAVVADPRTLPYSLRILLENLLRHEDGANVTADDIRALADRCRAATEAGTPRAPVHARARAHAGLHRRARDRRPRRDARRDGRASAATPRIVEPGIPVDLVIDHSIIADVAGVPDAFARNAELEFERNRERYTFLRWAQPAFRTLRVFPPEPRHLPPGEPRVPRAGRVPRRRRPRVSRHARRHRLAHADGQRSRRARLGRGRHRGRGRDARPAALDVVAARRRHRADRRAARRARPRPTSCSPSRELLREHGVVGKFVEFYGDGVGRVPLENRATIGNMSPEYGSTCTIFPIDDETLRYLRATGRPDDLVALVETYAKEQGLWHDPAAGPVYDETLELDLSTVEPSLAGPARPQDRVPLSRGDEFEQALLAFRARSRRGPIGVAREHRRVVGRVVPGERSARARSRRRRARAAAVGRTSGRCSIASVPGDARRRPRVRARRRHVVIAAITSCTNTSNPSVMIAAGLLARNAVARGLDRPAVGEDVARARFARRHRLLRASRGCMAPLAEARLRRRRLRLHDVHRQLRAARARDLGGDHRAAISRLRRCSRATATSRVASTPTAA